MENTDRVIREYIKHEIENKRFSALLNKFREVFLESTFDLHGAGKADEIVYDLRKLLLNEEISSTEKISAFISIYEKFENEKKAFDLIMK